MATQDQSPSSAPTVRCDLKPVPPLQPSVKSVRSPQNENVVAVNAQTERGEAACKQSAERPIVVPPQPLQIQVDNGTDWPTIIVGCAGILSSIIIARYTSKMQGNQIKANIANLRQRWIEDLRACSSLFLEKMTYIYNKIGDHQEYFDTPESTEAFSAMLAAQIKVSLMLDIQHERNRRAIAVSERIIGIVKLHAKSNQDEEITNLGREFEGLIREILESAWQDIKRDLLASRWYDLIWRTRARADA